MFGSFKIIGAMALIMAVMTGGFYLYYRDSQKTIATLNANAAKLEAAVAQQKAAIKSLQLDIQRVSEINQQVEQQFAESRQQVDELQSKFNRVSKILGSRDIGKMAQARPSSIERIINAGTVDVLRCFEIASGDELTESERNAEKPSQLNKSCPTLANPNRSVSP